MVSNSPDSISFWRENEQRLIRPSPLRERIRKPCSFTPSGCLIPAHHHPFARLSKPGPQVCALARLGLIMLNRVSASCSCCKPAVKCLELSVHGHRLNLCLTNGAHPVRWHRADRPRQHHGRWQDQSASYTDLTSENSTAHCSGIRYALAQAM